MLIEVSADLRTILNARVLSADNGFVHASFKAKKLDFSGLSYDSIRDTIWITSDQGKCLFQYDWNSDQVLQVIDLKTGNGDKYKRIRKSEGVAIDPVHKRMYVVSEQDQMLYVYEVHQKE